MDIPRLTAKLEAFLFTQKFASQVEELKPVCFFYHLFFLIVFLYSILIFYNRILKPWPTHVLNLRAARSLLKFWRYINTLNFHAFIFM